MLTDPPAERAGPFRHAVSALCLSHEQIAAELGVSAPLLEAYERDERAVPPLLLLALVNVVKAHEVTLGAAASALFEEAMLRLTAEVADRIRPPEASPPA